MAIEIHLFNLCSFFIGENKLCSDQKYAISENDRFTDEKTDKSKLYIWLKQGSVIGKSKEACSGKKYSKF